MRKYRADQDDDDDYEQEIEDHIRACKILAIKNEYRRDLMGYACWVWFIGGCIIAYLASDIFIQFLVVCFGALLTVCFYIDHKTRKYREKRARLASLDDEPDPPGFYMTMHEPVRRRR